MTHDNAPNPLSEVVFTPESEEVLGGKAQPRRRIVSLVVTGLALTLVLALVAGQGILPGVRAVSRPTPLPQVLGAISLYSTVNYGTLTINGQPSQIPFFSGMLLILHTPTTRLTLTAPPFHPVSCTLTAPHITSTGCWVKQLQLDGASVTLPLTLADLPADQEAAALQAADAALSQAAATLATPYTVPAGGYYATSTGAVQRATQAMRATITFAANFSPDCLGYAPDAPCALDPIDFSMSQYPSVWGMGVAVSFMWRFQTADGRSIAGPQGQPYLPLLLSYSQPTGWSVIPFSQNGMPGTLTYFVMTDLCDMVLQEAETHIIKNEIVQSTMYTKVGTAGCDSTLVIVATSQQAPSGSNGEIIIRFGVALAVGGTQALFPTLPLATAADLAAVDNQ